MEPLEGPSSERLQIPTAATIRALCLRLHCLEASVVVELDGGQHSEQMTYDRSRDDYFRAYGFRVLRFWNNDALSQTEVVLETILQALHRPEMDGRFD